MAKEVLAKIQEAEEENQQHRLQAQETVNKWSEELQAELSSFKQEQQERISEQIAKRKEELEREVQQERSSLFSNQKEADRHFKELYEKNKKEALQLIMKKVRENYGS